MAYSTVAITSLTDALNELATFAIAEGWTVTSYNFTPPSGGETVTLAAFSTGAESAGIDITMPSVTSNKARMNSPRLNGTSGTPDAPAPSAIHMFAGTEQGVDFLAAAINFSGAGWRHIYIGGVVPTDAATPGQVVAANWHFVSQASTGWPRDARTLNKYMFGAYNQVLPETESGFAYIPFGAGASVRPNITASGASNTNPPESTVGVNRLVGGAYDGPNDTLVQHGQVHFAAATVLVSIQLYVTEGSPARLVPIGHVAGMRMVNITNYNVAQQVQVGPDDWRVFPEFAKTPSTSIVRGTQYAANEASGNKGLAYPEAMAT